MRKPHRENIANPLLKISQLLFRFIYYVTIVPYTHEMFLNIAASDTGIFIS